MDRGFYMLYPFTTGINQSDVTLSLIAILDHAKV
jgi:hypothetical protein